MIPAETQRFMAERMKARVWTAPPDHMPMLTTPPVVVEIVLEAVREVEPAGDGSGEPPVEGYHEDQRITSIPAATLCWLGPGGEENCHG
jgi:hypothetical protein